MDLQQIRYFLALAQELHFWHTAEKMHITQSALSRHIQALEAEIGAALFERNKRNVKLTAAGAFLRSEWTQLLTTADAVHRRARQLSAGEVGELKIGHPGSVAYSVLPDLLAELAHRYPNWRVELVEIMELDLEQALFNYHLDLGLRREVTRNPRLESRLLGAENFVLVLPAAHALTAATFSTLTGVRQEKFILPSLRNQTQYVDSLRAIFAAYQFEPIIQIESDFGATILNLVARGLGLSIMPASYASGAPKGVRFIELPHQTQLYAIWRKDDTSPVLQNVLNVLEAAFAQ